MSEGMTVAETQQFVCVVSLYKKIQIIVDI